MISIEFAGEQIERLGGMYRFPDKYPAAVVDLAKALAHYPETTEELATAVIDTIKETATTETPCPMPAEIRSMVNARLDPMDWDPNCAKCSGTGTIMTLPDKDGYTYGKGCTCLARRPPVKYPRNEKVAREMAEEVSRAASAKRV